MTLSPEGGAVGGRRDRDRRSGRCGGSPVPYDALARPVLACGQTNGTGALFDFFAPGGRGRALAVLFRGANETTAHAMATENITQLGAPAYITL